MRKNLVTILITNFNKEFFLKKSIKSCIYQNHDLKEIIVFDDCSDDNSLNILKKFKKKIKLIKNKNKKFKSGPLNQLYGLKKLVKYSRGNLIFLLDSDDFFKQNKLKIIHDYFHNNKNVNFIQDTPYDSLKKKKLKLKNKFHFFSIWPSFYPTSTISMKKKFFLDFIKYSAYKKYPNLEVDARLVIYAHLTNNFRILKKSLTIYNFDNLGITSHYNKYSLNWWKKRYEGFSYMKFLSDKMGLKFKPGPDYYLTCIINLIIRSL